MARWKRKVIYWPCYFYFVRLQEAFYPENIFNYAAYTYDANGNPTLVTNDLTNITREMYWDENNRLMALSDKASWILTFTILLVFTNGEALLMSKNQLYAPLLL